MKGLTSHPLSPTGFLLNDEVPPSAVEADDNPPHAASERSSSSRSRHLLSNVFDRSSIQESSIIATAGFVEHVPAPGIAPAAVTPTPIASGANTKQA